MELAAKAAAWEASQNAEAAAKARAAEAAAKAIEDAKASEAKAAALEKANVELAAKAAAWEASQKAEAAAKALRLGLLRLGLLRLLAHVVHEELRRTPCLNPWVGATWRDENFIGKMMTMVTSVGSVCAHSCYGVLLC